MLEEEGAEVELVTVRTSGDEGGPASRLGDKSRFVKEIEEALLAGEADLAVHSAKDVPGVLPEGLALVGVPERAEASDALCGAARLEDLAPGARVGTSSLRRRAQLLSLRPDLEVVGLRGNVDTRLRKLAEGHCDAVVLATAGLVRLGRAAEGEPLPAAALVPAPGQGCLALEAPVAASAAVELAGRLTHRDSLVRLTAERALVSALDATCHTPIGAHAVLAGDALRLSSFVGLPDGSEWIRDELEGDREDPAALGREAAWRLLAVGAGELLAAAEAAVA